MTPLAFLLLFSVSCTFVGAQPAADPEKAHVVDAYGAIIRGDLGRSALAIVFTGDEFADGGDHIRRTLQDHGIKASFFLTGRFYATSAYATLIRQLKEDGHYLGAHSDQHLLYADWTKRDSLLVTEKQFNDDLLANYEKMSAFGVEARDARYFLPPYEWYNATIVRWTENLGLTLINFSPGTRSAADYTFPETGDRYVSSDVIYESIMQYEQRDSHGLNGFILLVHIGTDPRRTDKFYYYLPRLITWLKGKGYTFLRIDELLGHDPTGR